MGGSHRALDWGLLGLGGVDTEVSWGSECEQVCWTLQGSSGIRGRPERDTHSDSPGNKPGGRLQPLHSQAQSQ